MERAIRVMDYAIVIISGVEGVEGHTETVWRLLRKQHIPTFFFINKTAFSPAAAVLLYRIQVYWNFRKNWICSLKPVFQRVRNSPEQSTRSVMMTKGYG